MVINLPFQPFPESCVECLSWAQVVRGVPQGSVLVPLLFVNNIPDFIECNVRMFTDNTKVIQMITLGSKVIECSHMAASVQYN